MAKKRAKVSQDLFQDTSDLFKKTEQEEQREKEKRRQKERLVKRATYDMTAELKEAVVSRATQLGIPASQLAMFLLCDALRRFDAGDITPLPYLEESTSPKFRNNLIIDEEWYHLDD